MRRLLLAVPILILSCAASASAHTVYQWGSQAGSIPAPVAGLNEVIAIDAGNGSGYALRASGTVWAWGTNKQGQLGNGGRTGTGPLSRVAIPNGVRIVSIGEAKNEGFAIDSEGHGWVWGANEDGSACLPSNETRVVTPVELPVGHLASVQGGNEHSLWVTTSGHVLVCGSNFDGVLGLGENATEVDEPTEIPGLSGIVEVSAGVETSAARTATGELFAWGNNRHDAVGIGGGGIVYTPQRVSIPPVKQVSTGGGGIGNGSSYAITNDNVLYAWGDNVSGQVPNDGARFVEMPFDTGLSFVQAIAGGEDGFGLTAAGEVYAWGADGEADLGNGFEEGVFETPMKVDEGVMQISATAKNALDLH